MTAEPPREGLSIFGNVIFTLGALSMALNLLGMARVAYDVVLYGNVGNLVGKLLLLFLVFAFGLGLAMLSRRYGITGFSLFAQLYTWAYLSLVSLTYLGTTFRVASRDYSLLLYGAFLAILLTQLLSAFTMRLVVPARTLGIFAIPMLAIVLFHLLLVVYQYVFADMPLTVHLAGDLFFLLLMTVVSSAMAGQNAFRVVIERAIDKVG
jgi:hypothetical protein